MLKVLGQHLLSLLITLWVVSSVVFVVIRLLPGDPLNVLYGIESGVSPATRAALERTLGLDQPLPVQYWYWLQRFVTGDWGHSVLSDMPVRTLIFRRLPWTTLLTLASTCLIVLVAFPLGTLAALRRDTVVDVGATTFAMLGQTVPSFLVALALILLFSLKLGWLPSLGHANPFQDPVGALRHLALPAVTLSIGTIGMMTGLVRASLLEEMNRLYTLAARAKGLTMRRVMIRHVMRNALIPTTTVLGLWVSGAMSGAVVVESMFSWPGIGLLLTQAILNRDYPVVQSLVLVVAAIVIGMNVVVDLLYRLLDPRIGSDLTTL